jgi:hypothetical protein
MSTPSDRRRRGAQRRTAEAVLLGALLACLALAPAASGGPTGIRIVRSPGKIVPIPASVPHQAGSMIDKRLIPNLKYLVAHFPIYISEGYAGPLPGNPKKTVGCPRCHVADSDHKNGLAVDIGPLNWSPRCDKHWKGITRLANWAEPKQNRPRAPFRWVGYNGDAGHGCGNHLHLSWTHADAKRFKIASWVEVFGGGTVGGGGSSGGQGPSGGVTPNPRRPPPHPATGGFGPGD